MIRKTESWLGRHKRHVAVDAVAAAFGKAFGLVQFGGSGVALQAFFVEEGHGFLNGGFVRVVAGEA